MTALEIMATLHPLPACKNRRDHEHFFSCWSNGKACFKCDFCSYVAPNGAVVFMHDACVFTGKWLQVK